jgi:nitrilase
MSHIARAGGCWVIGTGTPIETRDVPVSFPGREQLFPQDEWSMGAVPSWYRPFGRIEAGPLKRDKGTLYAEIKP